MENSNTCSCLRSKKTRLRGELLAAAMAATAFSRLCVPPRLQRVVALRLRGSRTSTLRYRDHDRAVPEIASELGVDMIVEGGVRQDGDKIRITAQLIDGEDDSSLWSGTIEKSRSIESLFAIQDEFASEIANALKVRLESRVASDLPTGNFDAYDAFLLGKFHYRRKLPDFER